MAQSLGNNNNNNNGGGGPQWANPHGIPSHQQRQQQMNTNTNTNLNSHGEEEFFAPLSTLDEPVMETIMRDVRSVASKLKVVMLPLDQSVSECVCVCVCVCVHFWLLLFLFRTFT
jgi:hypothetical protein